jgi:hypothetical protein
MTSIVYVPTTETVVTVTETSTTVNTSTITNEVVLSNDQGPQGIQGATGAKGDTGDQGPSGVIAVTAPITNSGTSTSATIGVDAGSTSTAGVLQLTDSTSSTSTTTAATPNAVKSAYDLAIQSLQMIRPISTAYYRALSGSTTGTNISANTTTYTPIFFSDSGTFDRIACRSGTGFVGTSSVRLAIYNDNNGRPGTVLLDAGTVAPAAANTGYEITISQAFTAGIYWLAINTITAATTNAYY